MQRQSLLAASSANASSRCRAICEMVEDFSLVTFTTLCATDKDSLRDLLRLVDKANGYAFADLHAADESLFDIAAGAMPGDYNRLAAVKEKYDDEEEEMVE